MSLDDHFMELTISTIDDGQPKSEDRVPGR
jgi:hypothetical protein